MKKLRSVIITLTAASVIATSVVFYFASTKHDKINDIENYIETMNIDDSYYLRADNNFYFSKINENKPVELLLIGFNEKELEIVNEILSDLNLVFSKMNANIRVYATIIKNDNILRFNSNIIICERLENLKKPNVAGTAFIGENYIQLYSKIPIDSKISQGGTIFLHEVLHFFGLGDAYLIEDCESESIMHNFENPLRTNFLSTNDIKMLASMFGKFENENEVAKFLEFAENFGAKSQNRYEMVVW